MSLSIGLSIGIDRSFSGQAGGGLSAPTLGYPSPLAANPSSIVFHAPVDWQMGDVPKLAVSSSPTMSSPAIYTRSPTPAIQDSDIVAGTFVFPLPTFSGINYIQIYGNHAGTDSANKSPIVTWGDTVAPTITTAATASVYEQVQLAVTLAATDTGGVPALVSDGTKPGWYISGGADQLQFQIAIVGGVPTLQWWNNGVQVYSSPANVPPNNANPYNVQVTAIDYGGNKSAAQSIAVTVNAISVAAFSFTNVGNAPHSTLETSNTVTFSIAPAGVAVPASVAGTGFTYSKNGGAYQAAGSFTVQNGDTLTLEVTSGATDSVTETATVTVNTQTANWTVSTPGSAAILSATDKSNSVTRDTNFQAHVNADQGAPCLIRANIAQANQKGHFEVVFNAFNSVSSGTIIAGIMDSATAIASAFPYPGQNTNPGFSAVASKGSTTVNFGYNGSYVNTNATISSAPAVGDALIFDYDYTVHTMHVRYYHVSGGTVDNLATITLTSDIPSTPYAFAGGFRVNDQFTVNFGASAWLVTPDTGYTYYA